MSRAIDVITITGEEYDNLLADKDELAQLRAENANYRAAIAGKTFFHDNTAVMAELGRVRAENEGLRAQLAIAREQGAADMRKRATKACIKQAEKMLSGMAGAFGAECCARAVRALPLQPTQGGE